MKEPSERLNYAMRLRNVESAAELARLTGLKVVTVRSNVNGTRGFSNEAAEVYARALKVDVAWLSLGKGSAPKASMNVVPIRPEATEKTQDSDSVNHPGIRSASAAPESVSVLQDADLPRSNVSPAEMPGKLDPYTAKKVPLLGMAEGGSDGSFILNTGEPLMYIERPIGLAGRDRVYALRVEGNSMYPIFEDGDLIFVDPGRKAIVGRDAIIELYSAESYDHQTRALLKRIVSINGEFITVKEWQPKEHEFKIPRKRIKALHLVLKNSEMY